MFLLYLTGCYGSSLQNEWCSRHLCQGICLILACMHYSCMHFLPRCIAVLNDHFSCDDLCLIYFFPLTEFVVNGVCQTFFVLGLTVICEITFVGNIFCAQGDHAHPRRLGSRTLSTLTLTSRCMWLPTIQMLCPKLK